MPAWLGLCVVLGEPWGCVYTFATDTCWSRCSAWPSWRAPSQRLQPIPEQFPCEPGAQRSRRIWISRSPRNPASPVARPSNLQALSRRSFRPASRSSATRSGRLQSKSSLASQRDRRPRFGPVRALRRTPRPQAPWFAGPARASWPRRRQSCAARARLPQALPMLFRAGRVPTCRGRP